MRRLTALIAFVCLLSAAALLISQPAPRESVGPDPRRGGYLLHTGWHIKPAGTQVPLDTFPMSSALTPDGRFLLILNGGYNPPSISVLDTATMRELGRTPVPDAWLGLTITTTGRLVYVGGGSRGAVFEFTLSDEGKLSGSRTFPIVAEPDRTHRDDDERQPRSARFGVHRCASVLRAPRGGTKVHGELDE